MNKFLVQYRHWLLGVSLFLAAVCAVLIPRVHINTDLTRYLPNKSNMRAGLEVMEEEFSSISQSGDAGIRLLCNHLTNRERVELMNELRKIPEVNRVTEQESGIHTLYELSVANDVNQVALGKQIAEKYPQVNAVETSQDGATAEAPMLLGGMVLLLIILFAMCQSWLEPVLFLISTGVAVLLNLGTNALLPSVSVTTHSIAAILQLVLSIDYSIVLIHRFRQERPHFDQSTDAMQSAIQKATPTILSSAFTTIVGLMMLAFMKLKIGADLGIVLSKGVLCSLICNFTVLPSLIIRFEKGIDKSQKPVLKLPTDTLANFCYRARIPLTVAFILIFVGSFLLQRNTTIKFQNSQVSKINPYFPKKNPFVLIYDNQDENQLLTLMDTLLADNGVEMVISYPTLLQREYTPAQLVEAIGDLSSMANGIRTEEMEVPSMSMDLLSEDVLKVVYYTARDGGRNMTMTFNDMADFLIQQAHNPNSFLAKAMDDNLKEQIRMLEEIRQINRPDPNKSPVSNMVEAPAIIETKPAEAKLSERDNNKVAENPILSEVTTEIVPSPTKSYSPYTDTALLRKSMTATQMAKYLTMEESQAKTIYRLAKRSGTTMTPVEFIHYVTDEILQRKVLAMTIKEEQKSQLLALQHTMDSTLTEVSKSKESSLLYPTTTPASSGFETVTATKDTLPVLISQPAIPQPVVIHNTPKSDPTIDLIDELLSGEKTYDAKQMSHNIALLGEDIPESLIELLYLYYGGNHYFDDSWTMSLEQLFTFLADSMSTDARFDAFLDDEMRAELTDLEGFLSKGIGQLRSDKHSLSIILTNYEAGSPEAYAFVDQYNVLCNDALQSPYYSVGESVMLSEMKDGFGQELTLVTLLTIAAIFLIVTISFRSPIIALILVMAVMSSVYINVIVSGIDGGSILYLAYLIVQSILMGAAIDYGILFTNYYRDNRKSIGIQEALKSSYRSSIHTILTSGLILVLVPAIMAILVADPTIADIVRSIAIGAFAAVLIILFCLPGVLATCDKLVVPKQKRKEQ